MIDAVFIITGWVLMAYFLAKKPKEYDPVDYADEEYHLK